MKPITIAAATAAAAALLLPLAAARGQTLDGRGRGLDSLDESTVIARLNADGMNALLDRDLDVYKVPATDREALKSAGALQSLAAAGGLKPADQRALAVRVAKGLDVAVAKATDPALLEKQAGQLTTDGVDPTVNQLQYFGSNPATQAQLNPVVATVRHMMTKAQELAQTKLDAIANQINNTNFNQMQGPLKAAGDLKVQAVYANAQLAYPWCISLPKDDPRRAAGADEGIATLQQWNNPGSGIQATAELFIGKLQLAKGDTAAAKTTLAAVAAGANLVPAPRPDEQNDARYFSAVADLDAGDFAGATKALADLTNWQQGAYLPSLQPGEQDGVKAVDAMLQARIYSAQADAADKAGDAAGKQQFNDQAVATLSDLVQNNNAPGLRDLVFDQLGSRISPTAPVANMNVLALQAVEQQALDEYNKPDGQPVDQAKMRRGLEAAREIAKRDGQPGVTPAAAGEALYFYAYAQETKLHDDPAAAAAFMDFMERYPSDHDRAADAMEHAGAIVTKMHREAIARQQPDPAEAALYDRFLPLAVNPPYNDKRVVFDYAELLRSQDKFEEAMKYYALVPPTDKRYGLAQFATLRTLFAALGDPKTTATAEQRRAMADQLQQVAHTIDGQSTAAAGADGQVMVLRRASARYDAAISARRDLNDPAKAIAWLDGLEQIVAPLTAKNDDGTTVASTFVVGAQTQRVQALMALGKSNDAVNVLVGVMKTNPAAGENLVGELAKQIDQDLAVAQQKKDVAAQRELTANKAVLTGFMLATAQASTNPEVRGQLDVYRLYDADSKRQAAELAAPGPARANNLKAALAGYQAVLANGPAGDVLAQAQLGTGLVDFALGDYKATEGALQPLVVNKKLGLPQIPVNGQQVANPQYWEATYKYYKSVYEVAKANPADAAAKRNATAVAASLNTLLAIHGDRTGGYHDDLLKLRDDLKPFAAAK